MDQSPSAKPVPLHGPHRASKSLSSYLKNVDRLSEWKDFEWRRLLQVAATSLAERSPLFFSAMTGHVEEIGEKLPLLL